VCELAEDPPAVIVYRVGERPHRGDAVGVVEPGHPGRGPALPAPDRGGPLHDEADAALRGGLEFGDEAVGRVRPLPGVLEQRRAVEAISDGDPPDLDGAVEGDWHGLSATRARDT